MNVIDCIDKKRRGLPLTRSEIALCVNGFTQGEIPDYQMAALLMAICIQGMTMEETLSLTQCMIDSGERLDLSAFGESSMDKHSTGGVGDKTTLIVTAIVAAAGGKVAKMSGRGLGFTGGTADKLEAIPGYRIELPLAEFLAQVERVGCGVVTQSGQLAPADKKIYALRDVTATTQSIPLIAASIMSKKIAAGAQNIVLDVKVGRGAFMKGVEQAQELAHTMIAIGKAYNRRVTALLTRMEQPLGVSVGNTLEVEECVQVLKGQGPEEVTRVSLELSAILLSMGFGLSKAQARERAKQMLLSGKALLVLEKWLTAQGADCGFLAGEHPLPKASLIQEIYCPAEGYVAAIDALSVGKAACLLGAGRQKKGDAIDPTAGVEVLVKVGEYLTPGQPLFRLHTHNSQGISPAKELLLRGVELENHPVSTQDWIIEEIS